MSEERTAWGWGLASVDAAGTTLDVWYPELNLGEAPAESDRPNHNFGTLAHDEADARGIRRVPVFVVSQLDEPISNATDAYLKLHLMRSHDFHLTTQQGTQRLHQTLLHTHSIRLDLPAVISGAIISQVYKISLHGLFCVQR